MTKKDIFEALERINKVEQDLNLAINNVSEISFNLLLCDRNRRLSSTICGLYNTITSIYGEIIGIRVLLKGLLESDKK